MLIKNLYDLDKTIAKPLLETLEYPWEALPKIKDFIIELGKTLEVNTHHALCPNEEILKKYYEFGGRKVSFGSDAHRGDVYKDFDETAKMLKTIGFKGFTYFINHEEHFEPFD